VVRIGRTTEDGTGMRTAYLLFVLLTLPQHDHPDRTITNAPILIAKGCPDGYSGEPLKWGFYQLTKETK
jgi:hypothetical protein